MGALSVRDGGDHQSKKIAPIGMPQAGHRFVANSPLEGDGFELLVTPRRNSPRARHVVSAHGSTQLGEALIPRGTKSSNPSPSSNESVENSLSRTAANSASRKPEFSEHVCLLVAVGHDHSREPNARSVSFISCEGHGANHCEVDRARHIQSRRAHRRLRSDRRPLALGRLDPDPSCRRKSSAD